SASVKTNEKLEPGTYGIEVTVKDHLSGEAASFHRDISLKPTRFSPILQRFFFDADGKVPAPAGGVLGHTLHFRLALVGFDRSKGRIETHMKLEFLDQEGKKSIGNPFHATYKNDDENSAKQISLVDYNGF